jgi:hypothetical protein
LRYFVSEELAEKFGTAQKRERGEKSRSLLHCGATGSLLKVVADFGRYVLQI